MIRHCKAAARLTIAVTARVAVMVFPWSKSVRYDHREIFAGLMVLCGSNREKETILQFRVRCNKYLVLSITEGEIPFIG